MNQNNEENQCFHELTPTGELTCEHIGPLCPNMAVKDGEEAIGAVESRTVYTKDFHLNDAREHWDKELRSIGDEIHRVICEACEEIKRDGRTLNSISVRWLNAPERPLGPDSETGKFQIKFTRTKAPGVCSKPFIYERAKEVPVGVS